MPEPGEHKVEYQLFMKITRTETVAFKAGAFATHMKPVSKKTFRGQKNIYDLALLFPELNAMVTRCMKKVMENETNHTIL